MLANLIMVPVLGVLLVRWLDLPLDIRTGFLMLALASGRALRPAIRPRLSGQPCLRRRAVDRAVHCGCCGHASADWLCSFPRRRRGRCRSRG